MKAIYQLFEGFDKKEQKEKKKSFCAVTFFSLMGTLLESQTPSGFGSK